MSYRAINSPLALIYEAQHSKGLGLMSYRAINSPSALIYEAPDSVKGSGGEIISQFNRFKLKRSMQGRMDTMEWRPPVKANVRGKKNNNVPGTLDRGERKRQSKETHQVPKCGEQVLTKQQHRGGKMSLDINMLYVARNQSH